MHKLIKLAAIFGISLIAAVNFTACSSESDASSLEKFEAKKDLDSAVNVEITTLKTTKFAEYVEVPGVIKADVAATISAEEAGVVKRILRDKGTSVRANETIIELDAAFLQESYRGAEAAYNAARERYERQKNLISEKAIAEQQFLDTKYAYQQAKSAFEGLKTRLEKTRITSPINGRIDARYVDLGEFISPGTAVVNIIKTDIVKVEAGIPERYISDVKMNSEAKVSVDILGDHIFTGKISFIGATIHPSNRTFPVEIKLDNPASELKPNMFTKLRIKRKEYPEGFVVPRDAMIETESGKAIFIARDNHAERKAVKVIAIDGNHALVDGNFNFGDKIIIRGHRDLVAGEVINILN